MGTKSMYVYNFLIFAILKLVQKILLSQVEKLHISVADWLWSLKLLQASKATKRNTRLTNIPRGTNSSCSCSPDRHQGSHPDKDQIQKLESNLRFELQPLESIPSRDPTILPQTVLAHSSPFIQVNTQTVSPKGLLKRSGVCTLSQRIGINSRQSYGF